MKKGNEFVWNAARISFVGIFFFWILSVFLLFSGYAGMSVLMSFLHSISIIATFVLSIIHLKRYKQKGFAVTALVISSIGIVFFGIAFLIGFLWALTI
jgi:hypothetical protein